MVSTVIVIHIQVILGEEIGHVRLITLNRPRQLNVISLKVVYIYIYIYRIQGLLGSLVMINLLLLAD